MDNYTVWNIIIGLFIILIIGITFYRALQHRRKLRNDAEARRARLALGKAKLEWKAAKQRMKDKK